MSTTKRVKWGSPEWIEKLRIAGRKGGAETKRRKLAENPNYYSDIRKKNYSKTQEDCPPEGN